MIGTGIVQRSLFIAFFWLAGSSPCEARVLSAPTVPRAGSAPATLGPSAPALSLSPTAPLAAPSLFSDGALPTLTLPSAIAAPAAAAVRAAIAAPALRSAPGANASIAPRSPAPAAGPVRGNAADAPAPRAPRRARPAAIEVLREAAAGVEIKGRAQATLGTLFDANAPSAADPAFAADPSAALPPYLKIADAEDAAYLSRLYAAALRSKTGRAVLQRVEEYTGNGREPVIVEFAEEDGGSFTFDWEVVRMSKGYKADSDEKAAAALIHELVHVLQKGEDLPFYGVELELEAYIAQFKVVRELGAVWGKDDFHHGAYRSLKASVEGFLKMLVAQPQYKDSLSLIGSDFRKFEEQLRGMERKAQRTADQMEAYLKDREATLKRLRKLGVSERRSDAYRGKEVLASEEILVSWELEIHRVRRDLRILRTPVGRHRYLDFSRRVLREARAFRAAVNRADKKGASRRKIRLRLPTQALVDRYEPLPEARERGTVRRKAPPEIPGTPAPLPASLRPARGVHAAWLGAVVAELRRSRAAAPYLNALERRAGRTGIPWLVEVYEGRHGQPSSYQAEYGVFQINSNHLRLTPREFAPIFAGLISDLLHHGRLIDYALETGIEGLTTALMAARDLDVSVGKGHPLYAADRAFRRDFSRFMRWYRGRQRTKMLVTERDAGEIIASLERRLAAAVGRRDRLQAYLKARRATYRLMRQERIKHEQLRYYRGDEITGTESKLHALQARIQMIERDLALLSRPAHAAFYRRYADWVIARARDFHAARRAKS
ncbi:MAG: hypothetical protein CO113_12915 [Elusimicrobia bacterium CG_4_9_14_3_um_filter_62_55]|nr:MAG: hypothetical protein COR54_19175 [Elusimicrobia bacterium CG22_combo_CG10-13_8_21_14_all_63_91]PJA14221.1 MAG: hypothetical protein COX66_12880 [Elusimicrobia bacterium CG_4_10_14_0_2_um_filter_63_34]PJB24600.1 MAG: hypothetical protein CO113_12915 [Elusimicrobia bacterium CG_4_9_14_3_um_filter_62_55]